MSLASDSSETVEVTIIKLGTVTASDTRMHYAVLILACGLAGILRNMSSDRINLKTVHPPARRKKKTGRVSF